MIATIAAREKPTVAILPGFAGLDHERSRKGVVGS